MFVIFIQQSLVAVGMSIICYFTPFESLISAVNYIDSLDLLLEITKFHFG